MKHRYAIDGGNLYHRFMHSKRRLELADVRRAEIIDSMLELEFTSGKTEKIEIGLGSSGSPKAKVKFLLVLEKYLPVPLHKDSFLKQLVLRYRDDSRSDVPEEWQNAMASAVGEEIGRLPIRESWSAVVQRKLTPLSVAILIFGLVMIPVFTFIRVPGPVYLLLPLPIAGCWWLVSRQNTQTFDLVVGENGLGLALGKAFVKGIPYDSIEEFSYQVTSRRGNKELYAFFIRLSDGSAVFDEFLLEATAAKKALITARGRIKLQPKISEPETWVPERNIYFPAPSNTPRTK